jgi:endonuclease/exonuclease/phosphatase family metal-dependent hydrolase
MAAGEPTTHRRLVLAVVGAVLGFGLVAAPPASVLTQASAAGYAKPSGLGATVAAHAVGLHWKAVRNAPAYRVQFSIRSDMKTFKTKDVVGTYLAWTNLDPSPSAKSARLKPSTTYYFRVKVISLTKANLTSYGKTLKVKTASVKSMAELAPVALKSSVQSTTSSYISWSSRGPGVQYRIRYGTTSKLELGKSKLASSASSATVLKGLVSGTKYYYKVRTLSTTGAYLSNYSKTSSFTVSKTYTSPAIKVATYNVCSVACDPSGRTWTVRKPAVIANIAAQSPDILALQEMDRSLLADLLEGINAATSRAYMTSDPPSKGGSGRTKLAYDTQRFDMVPNADGSVELSSWDSGTRKWAVWAILIDKVSGKKLFVVSDHLVAGVEWQELRKVQTAEVVAMVAANNPDGLPVVIAGDFNSGRDYKPSNYVYDVLTEAGYREPLGNTNNSWTPARSATAEHRVNLDYNTYNGFDDYARRSKYDNGSDIDYIWHSPKIRVAVSAVAVDVDTAGRFVGLIPSDHNMLTATIHLP